MSYRPDISGSIDVRQPYPPQGVAIPGIPAGPATSLTTTLGSQPVTTVSAHVRRGRSVRAHIRLLKKRSRR